MTAEIDYVVEDPVATITLRRPTTLNALTHPMLGAFREAVVGWWETDASGSDTEPAARDQGELFAICRGFEISLESLPRLDRGAADPLSGPPAPATEPGERAQDRLAQLADRVLRELGDAVSGGRAPLR